MRLRAGTSGFSFEGWRGTFYPETLPPGEWLSFYAARLPAVEINNTFYRMPKADLLRAWAGQVAARPGFGFALKAPRRLTHVARLGPEAAQGVEHLCRVAEALGEHRGPLLFQLPPTLRRDLERLRALLALVPGGFRVAVEFRHASWDGPEVDQVLATAGAARVVSETDTGPAPTLPQGAAWGYLRLRRADYDDAALRQWLERLAATGWSEAWVFFKHEEDGLGPRLAARLLELAG